VNSKFGMKTCFHGREQNFRMDLSETGSGVLNSIRLARESDHGRV
jgi:hypothetical protein